MKPGRPFLCFFPLRSLFPRFCPAVRRLPALLLILPALMLPACQNLRPAQLPLVDLRHVHPFGATRVAFSATGKYLASGGFNGGIRLWAVPGGSALGAVAAHRAPVRGLEWVDDSTLLSASQDGELVLWGVLWNRQTARPVSRLRLNGRITALAFARGHRVVYIGLTTAGAGEVRAYRLPGFQPAGKWHTGAGIQSVAVDRRQTKIAVATRDRQVYLLDADLGNARRLAAPGRRIYELRFAPDGRYLAGGGWFKIAVWDLHSGRLRFNRTEHFGAIVSLDYHPQRRRIVSLGRHTDAVIRLADSVTGKVRRRLAAHEYCGWHIRFSPDGRYVASASEDESVRIYDLGVPYRPRWTGLQYP